MSSFEQTIVGDQPTSPIASPSKGGLAAKLKEAQSSIAAVSGAAPATHSRVPVKMVPQITQPKLISPSSILFHSVKMNLGAQYKNLILKFVDGYYQTDNSEEIAYLKANAAHFDISVVQTNK